MSTPEKKRTHEQSGGGGGGAIARKSSKKPRAALFRKCSVKDCGRDIGSDDEDEELSFCTECSCGAVASYRARERSGEVRCRGTNQQGARCGLTSSMVDINEEAAPLARGERCCGYHSGQGGTKWRMVHGNWEQFE